MNPLQQKIKSISDRLSLVLSDYNNLLKENFELKETILGLQKELGQEKRKNNNLEGNLLLLKKTTGNNLSNTEEESLDVMLDQYLVELDKCIASLTLQ